MTTLINKIIFILGFFSLIEGLEVFGISLIKVCLIVLLLVLLLSNILYKYNLKMPKCYLIYFYFFLIISCIISLFRIYPYDFHNIVIKYAGQSLGIYIPILVLLWNDKEKENYFLYFLKGLIWSIRINAIWALFQMILYPLGIDINQILFVNILRSDLERSWTMLYNNGSEILLRITGLNFEPSIFGLALTIGFFLDKVKLWRLFYVIMLVFSLSRTGLVMCLVTFLIKIGFKKFREGRNLRIRPFKIYFLFIILLVTVIFILNNESIQSQLFNVIKRFDFSDPTILKDGTGRHLLYYPIGIQVFIEKSDIFQQVFGYGPRISGVAFNINPLLAQPLYLSNKMLSRAWQIECDVIALLLGHGIIGFLLYYKVLIDAIKSSTFRWCLVAILIGGIMYHFYSLTVINLLLIFTIIENNTRRDTLVDE